MAVATQMCAAALGSQTGGSTCRPAAYNGYAGSRVRTEADEDSGNPSLICTLASSRAGWPLLRMVYGHAITSAD